MNVAYCASTTDRPEARRFALLVRIALPLLFLIVLFLVAITAPSADDCAQSEHHEAQERCETVNKKPAGPLSGLSLKGL